MSRSRDVSAVQNNLGVAIPPAAAGKNAVINGGFDIWQRGTSFTNVSTNTFTADRMSGGNSTSNTFSRQTTSDTTNLPNIQYCMRIQRTNGSTSTNDLILSQSLETVNTYPFIGKTVTLSFYARKSATASSSDFKMYLEQGTGTDQNLWTGYTSQSTVATATNALTTTWTRYSITGTVSASATQIGFYTVWKPSGTAGASDYVEITGIQLELGSSATPFSRAGGTIQGELANCQRYYVRFNANSTNTYIGSGNAYSTSASIPMVQMPVEMRVAPTSIDYAGVMITDDATNYSGGTVTLDRTAKLNVGIKYVHSSATLTAFRFYYLGLLIGSNGYLGINAEL